MIMATDKTPLQSQHLLHLHRLLRHLFLLYQQYQPLLRHMRMKQEESL
jgi:hypothetical protein